MVSRETGVVVVLTDDGPVRATYGGGLLGRIARDRSCLPGPGEWVVLRRWADGPLTVEEMLRLDAEGDAGVRRVLSDAGRTVGRAVADLANSLNPELVVVGGTLGRSPSLVDGLRASIDRYAQPDTAAALEVAPGALGDRSEVVGAVALAIARVAAA